MDSCLAKHKIGSEYFKDIAVYLCDKYTGQNDFKRYVTQLSPLSGADYFQ